MGNLKITYLKNLIWGCGVNGKAVGAEFSTIVSSILTIPTNTI